MQKKYARVYVIDCENVGYSFFTSPDDLVYYFTNNSVKELPFTCRENEIHMSIDHTGCKDALDFVIDTFLGYLVRNYGKTTEYFIISNDKGYENISSFWQGLGYKVYTNPHSIKSSEEEKPVPVKEVKCISPLDILTSSQKSKVKNIYNSWLCSRKKEQSKLFKDLERCLHTTISRKDIKEICDYYYNYM